MQVTFAGAGLRPRARFRCTARVRREGVRTPECPPSLSWVTSLVSRCDVTAQARAHSVRRAHETAVFLTILVVGGLALFMLYERRKLELRSHGHAAKENSEPSSARTQDERDGRRDGAGRRRTSERGLGAGTGADHTTEPRGCARGFQHGRDRDRCARTERGGAGQHQGRRPVVRRHQLRRRCRRGAAVPRQPRWCGHRGRDGNAAVQRYRTRSLLHPSCDLALTGLPAAGRGAGTSAAERRPRAARHAARRWAAGPRGPARAAGTGGRDGCGRRHRRRGCAWAGRARGCNRFGGTGGGRWPSGTARRRGTGWSGGPGRGCWPCRCERRQRC